MKSGRSCAIALMLLGCPSKPEDAVPVLLPVVQVKISDVGDEVEQNAVAARAKFAGKLLEFQGRLWSVDAGPEGSSQIGIFTVPPVKCEMRKGQDEQIAQLQPSKTPIVLMRGQLTGYTGGVLRMDDCRLVLSP